MKMSTLRSHLRSTNQLKDFLKDHQVDAFSRHYAQCYPVSLASHKSSKTAERLYNFMDVSTFKQGRITNHNIIYIMYNTELIFQIIWYRQSGIKESSVWCLVV